MNRSFCTRFVVALCPLFFITGKVSAQSLSDLDARLLLQNDEAEQSSQTQQQEVEVPPHTNAPITEVDNLAFNAAQERIIEVRMNDDWDWIRLTSGEWLKGEFKSLYDKEIEFESDILDTLYIDIEDVDSILSETSHSVLLKDGRELHGELTIFDGIVRIGDNPESYRVSDLLTIAYDRTANERNLWSARVGAGLNVSKGNTDRLEWSAQAKIQRRTARSRFNMDVLSYRTEDQNEKTQDNDRVSATFDWYENQRLYWRPAYAEFYRDKFQNIKAKITVGAGVGYTFIDTPKTEWTATAGPAYIITRFNTVSEGRNEREKSGSAFIETYYETEITKNVDLEFGYRFQYADDDAGGISHHSVLTFKTDITDDIDLDTSVVWDRLESPEPNEDDVIPEKDDFIFMVNLSIEI